MFRYKIVSFLLKMRKIYYLFFFFTFSIQAQQITTEDIESSVLGITRKVDLFVPQIDESYPERMPLIVVLEGNELFNVVVSNVQFLSKIGYMPKSIVVGIRHEGRQVSIDCEINRNSGELTERGYNFKQFINKDIVNKLATKYSLSNVKIIIGKNNSANFVNYFMLDPNPAFTVYISVTPVVSESIVKPLFDKVSSLSKNVSYYISNSENIPKEQRRSIDLLTNELLKNENPKFHFINDTFVHADEFSAAVYSIPRALERTFKTYQPISPKEYREGMLKDSKSAYNYLIEKYNRIFTELNIQKKYTLNDIMAVFAATQKNADVETLFTLGELTLKEYPDTMLGHYFKGLAYQMQKDYKKALKNYERAYTSKPIDFITKEMILNKIQTLK